MKNPFRITELKRLFDLLYNNPPVYPNGHRKVGSSIWAAFWQGYDGIVPSYQVKGSWGYAAWKAGEARKKLDERNGCDK